MYQGIIFDFNGVLLWDNPQHEQVWRDVSRRLRGTALTDEEFARHVHGRTNPHILQYIMNGTLTSEEVDWWSYEKEAIYREMCLTAWTDFRLSPGAVDLLDVLAARGIPRTIATASEKENVDFYVAHLDLARWFDVGKIVYGDGMIRSKPAPDMYLKAAENIGLSPAQGVVVEDSVSGMQAAHAAGIGYLIALGEKEKHARLQQVSGVDLVIEHLGQIPQENLFSER